MSVRCAVDIGGTFTDIAVFDESTGRIRIGKSDTDVKRPVEGVLKAAIKAEIDFRRTEYLVHGTTVATNAVVERRGAKVGLITTEGFRDIVEIMRCHRQHHYDLQWIKPKPLVPRYLRVEVPERVDYRGRIVRPLDREKAREAVRRLKQHGVEAIAICFIFSFANPVHEQQMAEIVREEYPGVYVSISSEINPEIREYERTSTVCIDAYVKPLVDRYMGSLEEGFTRMGYKHDIMIMVSDGGVMTSQEIRRAPVYTISSGPAGGVVGSSYIGGLLGFNNLITIDMGGTSFDASLVDSGSPRFTTETEVEWGIPVRVPMIDIVSIGAGGGSIAWIDKGGLMRVGPQSAGADPGPVCYRKGGEEPTVTDAYLILGVLDPGYFLGGEKTLDKAAAERAIKERIAKQMGMDLVDAANGIATIANANMSHTMKLISVERGYDPRDFALIAYGGAGPMVATSLAEELHIPKIIIPIYPGAFSAIGMLVADMKFDYVNSYIKRVTEADIDQINRIFEEMERKAIASLRREGFGGEPLLIRSADLRYVGQNFEVQAEVPSGRPLIQEDLKTIVASFNKNHERLYGYARAGEPTEFINLRLTAIGSTKKPVFGSDSVGEKPVESSMKGYRSVFFPGGKDFIETAIYERFKIPPGAVIEGPAIIEELDATIVVNKGFRASVGSYGNIIIERARG